MRRPVTKLHQRQLCVDGDFTQRGVSLRNTTENARLPGGETSSKTLNQCKVKRQESAHAKKNGTKYERPSRRKQQENRSHGKKQAESIQRQRHSGGQSAHARKNATKNERKRHRKQQANGSNGKKHAQLVRSGGQSAVHMKGKKRNRNERHRHRKQGQKARKRVKRQ